MEKDSLETKVYQPTWLKKLVLLLVKKRNQPDSVVCSCCKWIIFRLPNRSSTLFGKETISNDYTRFIHVDELVSNRPKCLCQLRDHWGKPTDLN